MGGGRFEDLRIGPRLCIPGAELRYETSRAGGPGGQNVNKLETRVTLRFDVLHSASLDERTRQWLAGRLASELTAQGELVLHASRFRSQARNLEDARERLAERLQAALERPRTRRATRPTKGSQQRRLSNKRHRGELKRERGSAAE